MVFANVLDGRAAPIFKTIILLKGLLSRALGSFIDILNRLCSVRVPGSFPFILTTAPMLGLLSYPDDGGGIFLRNIDENL